MRSQGRQGKRLAEGPSQAVTEDICEADRAVPVDRGKHWAEDHVSEQVPPCISKGPTGLAQWTLITSDRWRQRLGACRQGEPIADSLTSPGASPPACNPAGAARREGRCGLLKQMTRTFPVPGCPLLGPHLISSPSLWDQETTRWAT